MANKRVYYAIQTVTIEGEPVHGLQTVGVTTNFNLEQVFEMGQLAIYQNVEGVPDIEVTLNKVLDGYKPVYILATEGVAVNPATGPSIPERQNARCDVELSIFPDGGVSASGTATRTMVCSGMYVSSVSYTFPVDGNFTEDVTLVGNHKVWGAGKAAPSGAFENNDDEPFASTKVGRRQFLKMDACRFPKQIPGIANDGTNDFTQGSGFATHFQNITVSCDFGREAIQELGTLAPYHRYVTFPVEVTSEFEVIASDQGDNVQAAEEGYYSGWTGTGVYTGAHTDCTVRRNLLDEAIYIETCEGLKINLGCKNKLTSVNYTGGDTGGGNVSVTYSYSTYNDFSVAHSGGTIGGVSAPTCS